MMCVREKDMEMAGGAIGVTAPETSPVDFYENPVHCLACKGALARADRLGGKIRFHTRALLLIHKQPDPPCLKPVW